MYGIGVTNLTALEFEILHVMVSMEPFHEVLWLRRGYFLLAK